MLYQIQEVKKFMDTIIFSPAQLECLTPQLPALLSRPLKPPLLLSLMSSLAVLYRSLMFLLQSSLRIPRHASRLSLKPWSAPLHPITSPGPWSLLAAGEGGAPHHYIQLENKCDILFLHDFPPLATESQPHPPSPLPSRGSHSSPSHPSPPPAIPEHPSCTRARRSIPLFTSAPSPSTLIFGDSIVRNVSVNRAHTLFFLGATVEDITDKVLDIIKSR